MSNPICKFCGEEIPFGGKAAMIVIGDGLYGALLDRTESAFFFHQECLYAVAGKEFFPMTKQLENEIREEKQCSCSDCKCHKQEIQNA